MVCKHAHYSGRVQGVGFRMNAYSLALGYPITGFVRNLPNGDVELLAEGEENEVEAFLTALQQRMAGNIQSVQIEDAPSAGLSDFSIRY